MSRVYHVLPAADRDLDDQAAYLLAEASLDTALRFFVTRLRFRSICHSTSPVSRVRLVGTGRN
jgi:hypothetical protein